MKPFVLRKKAASHNIFNNTIKFYREEKVYSLEDNGTMSTLSTPMISDTSGLWLQKNGLQDKLLCGHIPLLTADVKESDGDEFYEKIVKPALINRVPNFKDTKVIQ